MKKTKQKPIKAWLWIPTLVPGGKPWFSQSKPKGVLKAVGGI